MKLQVLLMLFVAMAFSGCATREIIVTKEVLVPVPCVIPAVECKRTPVELQEMTDHDLIIELIRCIKEYDEKIAVCR